jgi:hypothetical protein
MVKLDNPGDWTIRTANSQTNQFIGGYAVLSYVSSHGDCSATKENLPGLCDHTLLWDMSQPNDRVWKMDDKPFLAWRDDQTPAIIDEEPFLDAGVAVAIKNGTVLDVVINVPAGQPTHVSLPSCT